METTMNAESKIYFVFKNYTKSVFKRDSIYTYFNENKIVTSSQKGGKKSILQKMVTVYTGKTCFLA